MVYKYNPAFLTDQDSIQSFVVRHKDLEIVSEILIENAQASSNRHVLVLGPRGSGKSTLARRLVAAARTNPDLSRSWYPVVLGEESYTITSAGEFWRECVFHLTEQAEHSQRYHLEQNYRQIQAESDDTRLRELSLGLLVSFATRIRKRLLLVVENFNMIMEDQMDAQEGWALRHALHNVPEVMLVATATKKFDQIENAGKALFEQFKIHELRPLMLSEIETLWGSLTREAISPEKTRPIQILTGGSPRLITILAEFAAGHSFTNLMSRLTSLIDQYTDYFKSQLDALANAERRVFIAVLEKWDPATTREIAEEARMPINPVSAQLSRLRSRGAVQRRSIRGSQYWEASERLFNLYYLMRRRGAPSSRVYALVKFMTIYYERDQLYERATDLAKECSTLDPDLRQDHYRALAQMMDHFDPNRRTQLLSLTPPDFAKRLEEDARLVQSGKRRRPNSVTLYGKIKGLLNAGNIQEASRLLESGNFLTAEYAPLWMFVGVASWSIGRDADKSDSLLKKARELDNKLAIAWYFHGRLFKDQKRYPEAIDLFKAALERGLDDANIWIALGESFQELAELSSAEDAYRTATRKEESSFEAWRLLGTFLFSRGKSPDEAEFALRTALKLNSGNTESLGTLATFLLQARSRTSEAEAMFREILQREPGNGRARAFLIRTLATAHRTREEIDSEFTLAMNTTGIEHGWRVSSAYADYLISIHEHEKAEQTLREATVLFPKVGAAWFELARYLAFQKRRAEAEDALRRTTQLAPRDCKSWRSLGEQLLQSEKFAEAAECFRCAIAVNPRCHWACHLTLASALFKAGRLAESLAQVRWLADHIDDSSLPQFLQLCILIAREGQRRDLLNTLLASSSREYFEPLVVALGLDDGDEPNVAREVLEVAKDIHRRITGGHAAVAGKEAPPASV